MDMQMPVMDGATAISILKSDNDLKQIPIIILTASAMTHEKDKLGSMANDFLLKPIYKYDLLALLTKYLPYEEPSVIPIKTNALPMATYEKLPIEMKAMFNEKFLLRIIKLQKTLNSDDLLDFQKELEVFAVKHNIPQLNEYSIQLKDSIDTFNIEIIYATLEKLSSYINDEERK